MSDGVQLDSDRTAAFVNSFRKATHQDDNVVKVDPNGKMYEVPNDQKERGILQKAWSYLKGNGYK